MSAPAYALGAANLPAGPLVQVIDTDERDDHADVTVQFNCTALYLGNFPATHGTGTRITLRLGPDCGSLVNSFPPEYPRIGGGSQLVTKARVEATAPGEVMLELSWSKPLDFVMAPVVGGLGLRVRLIGTSARKGSVYVAEPEAMQGYAVNLESSQRKIELSEVQAAAAALQAQAYVSETDIEDQHWYRLRVGPFATRTEAERVLQIALPNYPRAWVAINDEQTDLALVEHAGVPSALSMPSDPPLPDGERAQILNQARTDLANHQYPEAIDLLNRLMRQPEYPGRADAEELMGLVRERAGQLAQAKAVYEDYLRRYPEGSGAARVRARLQALSAASLSPKPTGEFGAAPPSSWSIAGSAALTYQYGRDETVTPGTSTSSTAVNAALVYGDLLVRDRGTRYDFTGRIDAGYTQNIATVAGGNQDRTTAAYVELTDHNTGLTGRLGRQSLAAQGVIGLFDGLYVNYQLQPTLSVSGAVGFPVYTGYDSFSTQQQFATVTAELGPWHEHWVFDGYLFDQTDSSMTDRRGVGFQARYTATGVTAVALLDYDVFFNELNAATLIANFKIGDLWLIGVNGDYRRSPLLELTNALIGQSATTLTELSDQYTSAQIKQLALDRTATSETFVLSASRPFGERWQMIINLATLQLSGTPASGGVPATPSTGLDKNASLQMSASNLIQTNDLQIFGVRYDDGPNGRATTLSWDARFALPGAWRLGPRFSVSEINDPAAGGRQTLYLPQVRGDWTGRTSIWEIIGGYQLTNQPLSQQQLPNQPLLGAIEQRSLYISIAYRLRF